MAEILETFITLRDQFTGTAKKVISSMNNIAKGSEDMASKANKAESEMSKLHRVWSKFSGKKKIEIEPVNLHAVNSQVSKLEDQLSALTGRKVSINATAKVDRKYIKSAQDEVKALKQQLEDMTGRKYDIELDVEGAKVGGALSGLGGAAKSAAKGGLLAAGAAAIGGVTSMFSMGSERQQYRNNMEFFLGDAGKAQEMMSWASDNAAKTQYSSGEVMGATSRAIQIAGGDTSEAKRFVQLAEDMASLQPGKSISDAMEALADAQMGEFERMKEFGFKGSADALKEAGGDFWKVKDTSGSGKTIEEMFAGGTAAGAQSAAAKIGTITGNFEDALGAVGEKLLNGLSPALDWVIDKTDGVGDSISGIADTLGGVFQSLWGAVQPLAPVFSTLGSIASGVLSTAFNAAAGLITGVVSPALSWLSGVVSSLLTPALEWLTEQGQALSESFEWVKEKAKQVSDWFGKAVNSVKGFVDDIKGLGSAALEAVRNSFGGFGGKVLDFVKWAFTGSSGEKNAQGTLGFGGGWTQMNENGRGEIVALPRGSRIYPYATTKRIIEKMVTNSVGRGSTSNVFNVNVDARGSNMSKEQVYRLRKEIVKDIVDAFDNTVPA